MADKIIKLTFLIKDHKDLPPVTAMELAKIALDIEIAYNSKHARRIHLQNTEGI